jgi:diacylglycerol kinase family enzyme
MYYYIVDPQKVSQREFERVQNLLYSSLSEFRIAGEVVRVTGLRTINQLVESAFSRGVKTLVAVGNEDTLNDVVNAIKGRDVMLGFIPIMKSEIGRILGITDIEQGAKTIAMRRIAPMDLGMVNHPPRVDERQRVEAGNYFTTRISFGVDILDDSGMLNYKLIQNISSLPSLALKFSVDNKYQGEISAIGGAVINARENSHGIIAHPNDGVLDVVFLPKLTQWEAFKHRGHIMEGMWEKIPGSSVVHAKKLEITAPSGLSIKSYDRVIAKTPTVIEVAPSALKIIVGKDRKF